MGEFLKISCIKPERRADDFVVVLFEMK